MTTVVTGAGGHVGSTLIRELLRRGRSVRALDLDHGPGLAGLDIERASGDIRDAAFLKAQIRPGDTVFHLASVISTSGDKGGLVSSVNVEGAGNVARVCNEQGVARLVHFSSIHAYDIDTMGAPVSEDSKPATFNSDSAYNVSKWKGQERVVAETADGLNAVVVNPCGVIGPYDYKASRMGKFFRMYAAKKNPTPGPGGFTWVDVRDVVAGALLAEEKGRVGEAYILAGHYKTNLELAHICAGLTGTKPPKKAMAWWFVDGIVAASPLLRRLGQKPPVTREAVDALRANPDVSHAKATRELGYQPRPIEDTVRDTFAWYAEEGILAKEKAARAARKAGRAAK